MDDTGWVWYGQETCHLFLALLSERLDYKEGNLKQPNTQGFKGNYFFFWQTNNVGGQGGSMIKRRRILSSRWSRGLSWTRRAAGRDAGSGWFLAWGTSLDPLPPRCHCHTRARRHSGWTPSLRGARTSLLKSMRNRRGEEGVGFHFQANALVRFVWCERSTWQGHRRGWLPGRYRGMDGDWTVSASLLSRSSTAQPWTGHFPRPSLRLLNHQFPKGSDYHP